MASVVIDVSSKLGEYMLKGWVLTDESCSNENCHVPLMRSPRGQTPQLIFCANCDDHPKPLSASQQPRSESRAEARPSSPSVAQSTSSLMHASRSSTPLTDLSSTLDSPTFAPLPVSAETLRRRQQSDAASAEIGSRLLKGWAMLADECPSSQCYGIPLVRPPRSGGEASPQKECVSCGTVYIDEGQGLTAINTPTTHVSNSTSDENKISSTNRVGSDVSSEKHIPTHLVRKHTSGDPTSESSSQSLVDASTSAEVALQSLSRKLTAQSSHVDLMDVASIGATAEAMGKVLGVLEQIKSLR